MMAAVTQQTARHWSIYFLRQHFRAEVFVLIARCAQLVFCFVLLSPLGDPSSRLDQTHRPTPVEELHYTLPPVAERQAILCVFHHNGFCLTDHVCSLILCHSLPFSAIHSLTLSLSLPLSVCLSVSLSLSLPCDTYRRIQESSTGCHPSFSGSM